MSRNQGSRVPGLDPAAVPYTAPSIAIPNLPDARFYANTSGLEQIQKALGYAGDLAYNVARSQRNTGPADRIAEQGMGRRAAMVPTIDLVAAFANDNVDQIELSPGDVRTGTSRVTLEDQLLGVIDESDDPTEALREWTAAQMQGDLESLDTAEARDAYIKEFFPKVYRSAIDWYSKKSEERQSVFRGEIAVSLAMGDFDTSPERLVSLSKQDNRYVEALDVDQAVSMIYEASEIAIGNNDFPRAKQLLQSVGLRQRDADWFKRADEWQEENAASVGRMMLKEALTPGEYPSVFTDLDEDTHPSIVAESEKVAATILVDPRLSPLGRREKLEAVIAAVDPNSPAALPFFRAYDQSRTREAASRSDQAKLDEMDAVAVSLRVAIDGEATVGETEIGSDAELRDYYVDAYGRSKGMVFFGEHLERANKPFLNPEESENTANIHIAALRDMDTAKERREYYEASIKESIGDLSSGDYDRIMRTMDAESKFDKFYRDERYTKTLTNLRREFYEAAGATETDSFAMIVRKNMKPMAHEAFQRIYVQYRADFRAWLSAEEQQTALKDNPRRFDELFEGWISSPEMTKRFQDAAAKGAEFAPEND